MKPQVICYMMSSVDGRIDCAMTEHLKGTDDYYEILAELNIPAAVSGRITAVHHYAEPGVFEDADMTAAGKECVFKAADSEKFNIILDTHGTLLWSCSEAGGAPLLCIVSESASQSYLDYLKDKGISYIAAGKDTIDLARAVEILGDTFGVKRLGVVGGGLINGAFLDAGLIDEFILLIGPGIDGRKGQPALFDGRAENALPHQLKLNTVKALENGAVLLTYSVL